MLAPLDDGLLLKARLAPDDGAADGVDVDKRDFED